MSAEKAVQRVLVLDLGSSSVRCTAFNLQCEAVQGSEVKENCAITDGVGDGERYYSAATSALKRCVEFLRGHDHKFSITAIGFSTLVMNLMGVDSNGHSVTPLYTYATRVSANAMQQLRDKVAEKADEVYRRTGTPLQTSYAPALFTHLSLESKGHDTRVARWRTIASLVISRWCRCEAPVSTSEASWMGLYDRTEDKWCEALMALFPEQVKRLPRLAHWGAETFRVVDPELPHETRDAAVHLGLPDGVAANLGCGSWDQSSACVTIGTSAALRTVVHGSIHSIPPGLWLYTIDEKRSLLGGALTDGGNIFAYLKDLLKFGSASEATDAAASAPACADGVLVMPFLGPERAPGWRARHLTITGVTHSTKPGTIMRAGLEGVAFRLALIYRLMKPQLSHTNFRLIAAGHSLEASQVWRQIVADTLDAQLALPSVSETTSRGVAVMIAQRIAPHSIPTLQENLMDPNKQHVEAYRAALTRHETLYTGIYGSS